MRPSRSPALALLLLASVARADSQAQVEPPPPTRLGPPLGAPVTAVATAVTISENRRTAHVAARFRVDAPPGPLHLTFSSSEFGASAKVDGAAVPLESARDGDGYLFSFDVEVPASGSVEIELTANASSGIDRRRRRRTLPEVTHMLARRDDYFAYDFVVAGPGGPVSLWLPARTDGRARIVDGALRIEAAERRHLPLGVTGGLGVAANGRDVRLTGRLALDLLLPWGDVAALGGEVDHRGRASGSVTYQLHTRWYGWNPMGGHAELGGVLDVLPSVRAGIRAGAGYHFNWAGLQLLGDLYPGDLGWRVTVLGTLGL